MQYCLGFYLYNVSKKTQKTQNKTNKTKQKKAKEEIFRNIKYLRSWYWHSPWQRGIIEDFSLNRPVFIPNLMSQLNTTSYTYKSWEEKCAIFPSIVGVKMQHRKFINNLTIEVHKVWLWCLHPTWGGNMYQSWVSITVLTFPMTEKYSWRFLVKSASIHQKLFVTTQCRILYIQQLGRTIFTTMIGIEMQKSKF